jgi:hypothetical protein
MRDSVELFGEITDIVSDCVKQLDASFPDGPDMDFVVAMSSPITRFSEKDRTPQVVAFESIMNKLDEAYNLAKELGAISSDQEFNRHGLNKLNADIHAINALGCSIYNDAVDSLKELSPDSPGANLVKLAYKQASSLYAELQVFVRKAKPKNSLPALQRLKPLPNKI